MHGGEVNRGDQKFHRMEGGTLVWDHQFGGSGFSDCGFDSRAYFLFRRPSSQLRGCCCFGLRLLRPGRLPGGGRFRLLGSVRARLGMGFGIGVGGIVALTTHAPRTPSRFICSAEGPARRSFGTVRWAVAALFRPRSGACFTGAALASFYFTPPR